jgi:hypothetical protein
MLSVILMQFFEFVLWRNIKNYKINRIFSFFGILLICIQPIASLFLITNISLRNKMLVVYTIPTILFFIFNIIITDIHTTISPSGHLSWKWTFAKTFLLKTIILSFYLFFLFFSLIYNKYYESLFYLFVYFLFVYYFGKDGSSGSVWCLFINTLFLYFLFEILIVMPYSETFRKYI